MGESCWWITMIPVLESSRDDSQRSRPSRAGPARSIHEVGALIEKEDFDLIVGGSAYFLTGRTAAD